MGHIPAAGSGVILLAMAVLFVPEPSAGQRQAAARLRLDAVRALVDNHTPDEAVAGEIASRGLESPPDDDWIAALRNRGAGSRTIAVLSSLVPLGTLTVSTSVSDAEVSLDGRYIGNSGPSSRVVVPNLRYAKHLVLVHKDRYLDASVEITVAARNASILVPSVSAIGSLVVTADVGEATLTVEGVAVSTVGVAKVDLPEGTYTVSATAPGYTPQNERFAVSAGRTTTGAIHLAPNLPAVVQLMRVALGDRNYRQAEKWARTILDDHPDSDAYSALATVAFAIGNQADVLQNARQALQYGAFRMPFRLYHIHDKKTKHQVTFGFNANYLYIEPTGMACSLPKNIYLPTGLRSMKLVTQKEGPLGIELDLAIPGHGYSKQQFLGVEEGAGALKAAAQVDVLRTLLESGKARQLSPLAVAATGSVQPLMPAPGRVIPLLDRALGELGGEPRDSYVVGESLTYPGGAEARVSTRVIYPRYIRRDEVLSSGSTSTYTDGTSGWQSTRTGTAALSTKQVYDLLLYSNVLHSAKYDASLSLRSVTTDTIYLQTTDGQEISIRFDNATGLPSAITHPFWRNGIAYNAITTFSDWRTVSGLKVAYLLVTSINGEKWREDRTLGVSVNTGLRIADISQPPR